MGLVVNSGQRVLIEKMSNKKQNRRGLESGLLGKWLGRSRSEADSLARGRKKRA